MQKNHIKSYKIIKNHIKCADRGVSKRSSGQRPSECRAVSPFCDSASEMSNLGVSGGCTTVVRRASCSDLLVYIDFWFIFVLCVLHTQNELKRSKTHKHSQKRIKHVTN